MTRTKLENYLLWLITPQDTKEQDNFKQKNIVDDYIQIKNSIPYMTTYELCDIIDKEISYTGYKINRNDI